MASMKLKLVIDKRENRVLFAEADKDFVDFICHILSLPLGTVTRILSESGDSGVTAPGCLGSLYEGIKVLDDNYVLPTVKERLLNSRAPFYGTATLQLLPSSSLSSVRVFKQCFNDSHSVQVLSNNTLNNSDRCLSCGFSSCLKKVKLSGDSADLVTTVMGGDGNGYVKPQLVFMVMDDLVVKPLSTVFVLSLMGMGPRDQVSNFENKEVDFGRDEAMKLLKASLQSKTVLTDVFLDGLAGNSATGDEFRGGCGRAFANSGNLIRFGN